MPAGHIARWSPTRDDAGFMSLPAGVDLRWFVGNLEQAATLVAAHFTAQPMTAEGSYTLVWGRAWSCRFWRHVRRTWMWIASGVYAVPYWRSGKR